MPEAFAAALGTPGLPLLVLVTFLAGLVYGFAGFGSAMVFMPLATLFVPPTVAVAALSTTALSSLALLVPRVWPQADRSVAAWMIGVSLLTAPFGLLVLARADTTALRWAVLAVIGITLAALVTGWRRRSPDTALARAAVAGATGFVGGATGLNGPVLILFQLSGTDSIARIRANTVVFLTVNGAAMMPLLAIQGLIDASGVALGVLLFVPYGAGSLAGHALFRPDRVRLYRRTAFVIIAVAIVLGLPLWS